MLAKVGDTYAVRLKDRSYGLCRIVWTQHSWRHTSVVGLDWFGKSPPDVATARGGAWDVCQVVGVSGRIDEDRYATRYWLAGKRVGFAGIPSLDDALAALADPGEPIATTEPPPAGSERVGNATPLVEAPQKVRGTGSWATWLPATAAPPPGRRESPPRAGFTLDTIRPDGLFAHWRNKVSDEEIAKTRKIVERLVASLGRAKTAASALRAIGTAVKSLNAADSFIETVEREELCLLLRDLGRSAGLDAGDVEALVDRERDW